MNWWEMRFSESKKVNGLDGKVVKEVRYNVISEEVYILFEDGTVTLFDSLWSSINLYNFENGESIKN